MQPSRAPLFPHALRAGDRIAIVSPSGPVRDRARLERGIARLRDQGFEPVYMPHCLDEDGYLAGEDAARAADLQAAIDDSEFRAILCSRGGYGASRIVDRIDWTGLANDPRPLLGYSDITVLLAAAWAEIGLVSLHGPMVATSEAHALGPACEVLQHELLQRTDAPPRFPADSTPPHPRWLGTPETAPVEGRLVGGNLALVTALLGTRWQIDTRGALFFLEDVDEPPYRIDRMLTHLRLAGCFRDAVGVVLGDFHYGDGTPLGAEHPGVHARIEERLHDLEIPVSAGWPFGHRPRSWTLPFGARARLADTGSGAPQLSLLEPAVR